MNEQELIIQGNQASVLMPELKRYVDEQIAALSGGVASKAYVDEQIAALSEKDKDTLFINFGDISWEERQILLYIEKSSPGTMDVYTDAYIPKKPDVPPVGSYRPIGQYIYDKYHESYPWLNEINVAKKVVDGYIVLIPVNTKGDYDVSWSITDTPWLRLGYFPYNNEANTIEQHLGWIRRLLGDDSGEKEDLINGSSFLMDSNLSLVIEPTLEQGRCFCLRGWMLLKNID